jgi:Ca2+-binding RTX toxin-like protein
MTVFFWPGTIDPPHWLPIAMAILPWQSGDHYMPDVTLAGANAQTVTLSFDTNANAALAQRLANAITAGVQAGNILVAEDTNGPPPALLHGTTGAFIQTEDGLTVLPHGYKAFVDTASEAVVFGSGDAGESVLSSTGDLSFFATGGSGTVVAGGGNNRIVLPSNDTGAWSINTGNGDDTVLAGGSGNDTINAGGGHNAITLGTGRDVLASTGDDTVDASSGQETIAAIGSNSDLIFGNSSNVFFVATGGSATVFGGTGSDTFFGGKGPDLVHGGTGGNNFLFAGTGAATLFGGGNGDQLFAAGSGAQALHAGAGNETLFGGFASGSDTFYGSAGNASITAGSGSNQFAFTDGQAGGTASIQGFTSGRDQIDLLGYGKNELANALKSQSVVGGSDTITLSDHTRITFAGVGSLTASDFSTSGGVIPTVGGGGNTGGTGNGGDTGNGGGMGNGGDNDDGNHGHGSQNHGMSDSDDRGQMRDSMFKHS